MGLNQYGLLYDVNKMQFSGEGLAACKLLLVGQNQYGLLYDVNKMQFSEEINHFFPKMVIKVSHICPKNGIVDYKNTVKPKR